MPSATPKQQVKINGKEAQFATTPHAIAEK